MADKKNSQTQKTEEFFAKVTEDQIDRVDAAFEEWGKLEEKSLKQVNQTVEEVTKLWKASFQYTFELSEQMRNMMVESTKQAIDSFKPRA